MALQGVVVDGLTLWHARGCGGWTDVVACKGLWWMDWSFGTQGVVVDRLTLCDTRDCGEWTETLPYKG